MKRENMNKILESELEHIPRGSRGSTQNQLRFYYSAYRRKGMVRSEQRGEALKEAISRLKEENPSFRPAYDESFFEISDRSLFERFLDRVRR